MAKTKQKIEVPKSEEQMKDLVEEQMKKLLELPDQQLRDDDGKVAVVKYDGKVKPVKRGDGYKFFSKRKMNTNPTTTYLITMLFGNGTMKHLVLEGKGFVFTYNKRKYHLNKTLSWYDVNHHQNRLMYYEDYAEPLNRAIHCDGDKKYLSITPDNITDVMAMEYVKVLSQSQQLSKWLKIAVFLMIANLALSFLNTLIFVLQSGILGGLLRR